MAIPDTSLTERGQGWNLHPHKDNAGSFTHGATMGTPNKSNLKKISACTSYITQIITFSLLSLCSNTKGFLSWEWEIEEDLILSLINTRPHNGLPTCSKHRFPVTSDVLCGLHNVEVGLGLGLGCKPRLLVVNLQIWILFSEILVVSGQ